MKSTLALLFVFLSANTYSQDKETREFISAFYKESGTIIYENKLADYQKKRIDKALAQDTLVTLGARFNNSDDRLILTKYERSYIDSELKKQNKVNWNSKLLKNGKLINSSTIDSVFNNKQQGWAYFYQQYGSRLYSFSSPIFIRENSLCIFYSGYVCGSRCGEGKLMIFKKENNIWVEWLNIFRWMS